MAVIAKKCAAVINAARWRDGLMRMRTMATAPVLRRAD
jgi:hypothetical protein